MGTRNEAESPSGGLASGPAFGSHGLDFASSEWAGEPAAPQFSTLLQGGAWDVAWAVGEMEGRRAPLLAYHESTIRHHGIFRTLTHGILDSRAREEIDWRRVQVGASKTLSSPTTLFRANLWARRSEQYLFFAFGSRELLRWFYEPLRTDYEQLRRDYAAYVPSPDFITVGDAQIRETLADGVHIDEIEVPKRFPAVRGLLQSMAELVEAKAVIGTPRNLSRLSRELRSTPLTEAREHRNEILGIFGQYGSVPLVVSVGDLNPRNVIVHGSGAEVIDFGELDVRPFWHDAFGLVRRSCGSQALVSGDFDEELHAIFDAAGVTPKEGVQHWARLSVLAFTVMKGAKRARKGRFGWRRMSRSDAREIQRFWAEEQRRLTPSK